MYHDEMDDFNDFKDDRLARQDKRRKRLDKKVEGKDLQSGGKSRKNAHNHEFQSTFPDQSIDPQDSLFIIKSFQKAVKKGLASEVAKWLETLEGADLDIDSKDVDGKTALMFAVLSKQNDENISSFLLEAGSNINAQDDDGMTALMLVIDHQELDEKHSKNMIEWLIEQGADVHLENHAGYTAMDLAKSYQGSKPKWLALLMKSAA
jgi:ankyrin repeat protein